MGILSSFTSPRDVRWQGARHHHHVIFLIKNIILFLFIILVVVEYALFKSWWEHGPYKYHKSWDYAPYHFWLRIGIALIPDALLTLVSLVLILNPMHHSTYSFHPVFALTTSLIMMSLYINVVWLNPLIALSNEVDFPHSSAWYRMALAETGLQSLLCIIWILLMGYSCAAVRNWRATKNPKAVKMGRIEVQEGNESENGRV